MHSCELLSQLCLVQFSEFSVLSFRLYFFSSHLPLLEFPPVFSYGHLHYKFWVWLIISFVCLLISCTFIGTLCLVTVMFKVFATACLPTSLELLLNLESFGTLFICLCVSCKHLWQLLVVWQLLHIDIESNVGSNHLTFNKTVTFLSIINYYLNMAYSILCLHHYDICVCVN